MSEKDFQCEDKCPRMNLEVNYFNRTRCCCGCKSSRKLFSALHPELKSFWTEEYGYWCEYGCKLSRKQMPEECKGFDCHNKVYYIRIAWGGDIAQQSGKFYVLAEDDNEIFPLWDDIKNKAIELSGVKNAD